MWPDVDSCPSRSGGKYAISSAIFREFYSNLNTISFRIFSSFSSFNLIFNSLIRTLVVLLSAISMSLDDQVIRFLREKRSICFNLGHFRMSQTFKHPNIRIYKYLMFKIEHRNNRGSDSRQVILQIMNSNPHVVTWRPWRLIISVKSSAAFKTLDRRPVSIDFVS